MNTEQRAKYSALTNEMEAIINNAKTEARELTHSEFKKIVKLEEQRESMFGNLANELHSTPTSTSTTAGPILPFNTELMSGALREMHRTGLNHVGDIRELRGAITGANSAGLIFEPVSEEYAAKLATPFELGEVGAILDANTANYTKFPYQSGDLIPNVIGEASAIDSGSLTIASAPVALSKFAVIQKVSLEVVEDYPGVWDMIASAARVGFSTAVSRRVFDRVINTSNIQTIDCTAVNATAFGYDNILQGLRQLEAVNVNPRRAAFVSSPRISENLAKLKDTTGQYIQPPAKLNDVRMLTTSAILETYSSNTATKAFLADWSSVRVIVKGIGAGIVQGGTRFTADANIPVFSPGMHELKETYIGTGELAVLFYLRCDVVVHRPDNVVMFDNLKF